MAWTRHGHQIEGTPVEPAQPRVARCGGPTLCRECWADVQAWSVFNPKEEKPPSFEEELRALINKHSLEGMSNTPDFILAGFLQNVLTDWNHATRARDRWTGSINKSSTGDNNG